MSRVRYAAMLMVLIRSVPPHGNTHCIRSRSDNIAIPVFVRDGNINRVGLLCSFSLDCYLVPAGDDPVSGETPDKNADVSGNNRVQPFLEVLHHCFLPVFNPGIFYGQVERTSTSQVQALRYSMENINIHQGLDLDEDGEGLISPDVLGLKDVGGKLVNLYKVGVPDSQGDLVSVIRNISKNFCRDLHWLKALHSNIADILGFGFYYGRRAPLGETSHHHLGSRGKIIAGNFSIALPDRVLIPSKILGMICPCGDRYQVLSANPSILIVLTPQFCTVRVMTTSCPGENSLVTEIRAYIWGQPST